MIMNYCIKLIIALLLFEYCSLDVQGDVEPSSMFGDHMVLQRGMPVPVWGRADPREEIMVQFAGHKVAAVANSGDCHLLGKFLY